MYCGSVIAMLVLATASAQQQASPLAPQDSKEIRRIPVPHREHGYGQFESKAIVTQDEFAAFLKAVESQDGWNQRKAFTDALQKAKINFATEALVLIRQTEGSGSNTVVFGKCELNGNKLVCKIETKTAGIGTADIADYCLALAVPKNQMTQIEVVVNGKVRETLQVTKK